MDIVLLVHSGIEMLLLPRRSGDFCQPVFLFFRCTRRLLLALQILGDGHGAAFADLNASPDYLKAI